MHIPSIHFIYLTAHITPSIYDREKRRSLIVSSGCTISAIHVFNTYPVEPPTIVQAPDLSDPSLEKDEWLLSR
jgi:hypothetical protein